MLSDRTLGPLPDANLLKELGLHLPSDHVPGADRFYTQAKEARSGWGVKYEAARQCVDRTALAPKVPYWWREKATLLVEEARRAGLRSWLSQTLAANVPIRTLADLRAWCLLQIMAFDVIEDAGIAHFCVPKNEPLLDRDLLLLILPLLSTEGSKAPATLVQQAQNWEDLERYTPKERWVDYCDFADMLAFSGSTSVPKGLKVEDWQALAKQAWHTAQTLSLELCLFSPPPLPNIPDRATCQTALEQLVKWCRPVLEGDQLSEDQRNILIALLECKATAPDASVLSKLAVKKGIGPKADPDSYKHPIAALKKLGYTDSKTGRGGGIWLTEKGQRKAKELADKLLSD